MGRGPGRAGAPTFSLGARGRAGVEGAGVGSSISNSIRPSRLRSSRKAAAGPRLLPLLAGAEAGAGVAGVSGVYRDK